MNGNGLRFKYEMDENIFEGITTFPSAILKLNCFLLNSGIRQEPLPVLRQRSFENRFIFWLHLAFFFVTVLFFIDIRCRVCLLPVQGGSIRC